MLALGLGHGFANGTHDGLDGLDGVVVAGDGVVDQVGIAVGIHDGHDGDAQFAGLRHGVVLTTNIHDEHGVWCAFHVADAAEVFHEPVFLATNARLFLLHVTGDAAVLLHLLNLLEPLEALLHGFQIRQHAAEPTVRHVRQVMGLGHLADAGLGLLLGAHQQQLAAAADGVANEIIGGLELLGGLREVDDVHPVVRPKNVGLHLGVPTAGLVSKMDTRFKQFLNSDTHMYSLVRDPCGPSRRMTGLCLVCLWPPFPLGTGA